VRAAGSEGGVLAPLTRPSQEISDPANLLEQPIEHLLVARVDSPLRVLALLLEGIEPLLQGLGARVDLVYALAEALLGLADSAFEQEAGLVADRVEFAA